MNETLLSTDYDKQFAETENLTWYPWIGKNYPNAERKILIIGESHYAENEDGTPDKECKEAFIQNANFTREIIETIAFGENSWNFFKRIEDLFDVQDKQYFWSNIAYFNLLQTPVLKKDDVKEKKDNYPMGWNAFLEIVNIIKPTDCIVMGLGSDRGFGKVMSEHKLKYSINDLEKITDARPRYATIDLEYKENFELFFIQHSRTKIEPWKNFLQEKLTDVMQFLQQK